MTSPLETLRRTCPRSRWTGAPKTCCWCGTPLTGPSAKRRRTWCSQRCRDAFETLHVWAHAKAAALAAADHRCTVPACHAEPRALTVIHLRAPAAPGYGPSCAHHGDNLRVLCRAHARQYRP